MKINIESSPPEIWIRIRFLEINGSPSLQNYSKHICKAPPPSCPPPRPTLLKKTFIYVLHERLVKHTVGKNIIGAPKRQNNYLIIYFSNIAIAILDFSLLLLVKKSFYILCLIFFIVITLPTIALNCF